MTSAGPELWRRWWIACKVCLKGRADGTTPRQRPVWAPIDPGLAIVCGLQRERNEINDCSFRRTPHFLDTALEDSPVVEARAGLFSFEHSEANRSRQERAEGSPRG
jgi:hypothetical protein